MSFEWAYYGETLKNIKRGKVFSEYSEDPDLSIYEYTYDEYIFPEIIRIIDEVLDGDEQQIQYLFETSDLSNLDIDINKYHDVEQLKKIKRFIEEYIKNNDKNSFESAKKLIEEYEWAKVIKPKKSVKEYYSELQKCFVFNKRRKITSKDLAYIKSLFGEDYREKLNMMLNYDKNDNDSIKNPYVKKILPNT
ncbi:MAG: hypothetical protein HFI86_02800 [Bacilli bacterium]|nr:hypothetical protein [Bacilli bacterium]